MQGTRILAYFVAVKKDLRTSVNVIKTFFSLLPTAEQNKLEDFGPKVLVRPGVNS
jgi:hypothetical protein